MAKNGKANGHARARGMGHNSGVLWLRRSYNIIERNPEIDRFRTLWQRQHIKENDLAVLAGLSNSTVHNMFGGETRDPRHSTFAKMAGAMNHEYGLVPKDRDKPDYEKEIPKAMEERRLYRATLAKKKKRARKK